MYQAHMGTAPAALADLTAVATNNQDQTAGPFLARVPVPPSGGNPAWPATYVGGYSVAADGTFTLTAEGDGTVITVP
jgi:hypothetical protein